jgi:hypothetical protein
MNRHGMNRGLAARWRALAALVVVLTLVVVLPRVGAAPAVWAQEAIAAPPAAPGPAAPVDGAILEEALGSVALQWEAVPGAVDYQVVLNGGERTGPWVTETSWSPGSLPEGTYQWAVQARNAAGIGALGPQYSFTVMPSGGYEASESVTTEDPGPLPFQLQQQAQQGEDGVAVESDGAAGSAPAPAPAPASNTAPDTATTSTTAAGTPVPTPVATAPPVVAEPAPEAATVADGADVVDNSGAAEDAGKNKDKKDKKTDDTAEGDKPEREKKDREPREDRPNHSSNGNGGVSEVVAVPPTWTPLSYALPEALRRLPLELHQQDATDATAGSVGENGTVNGRPRETTDTAPPETAGPAAPGEILLPPSVPGVPGAAAPNVNPELATGVGSTTELSFDAIADTTVFTSSPGSPQSPESVNSLAIGGPQGAVALMSFKVEGVGDGTVLSARLTFYGTGGAGAPGGSVGVIYDYVVPEGLTANGVPDGGSALNVHGAPSWFERVEPNGLTAVDVTGSVTGDGRITFVLPGQPEAAGAINSVESGAPPQLILTVALPA